MKKIVFDFNPGDGEAATPNYGSCRDFADYIKNLKDNGITTIAFVHAKTHRHSVLPVLACNDVVMSSLAKIGAVADVNETVPQDVVDMYARVAGPEKEAVVLKMLDRNITVVSALRNGNSIPIDLAKYRKKELKFDVFVNEANLRVLVPAGGLGLYSREDAMNFNLCTALAAENRQAIAEHSTCPPRPSTTIAPPRNRIKAVKIEVAGPLTRGGTANSRASSRKCAHARKTRSFSYRVRRRRVRRQRPIARDLADEIRELKNDAKEPVWTVAFIPNRTPDLATFIAFACSEIIMYKGSDLRHQATIGDFGPFLAAPGKSDSSNTPEFIRRNLTEIAERQGYSRR